MRRNTKIIATLGPNSMEIIEDLFLKGVNVFRLNFSHGRKEEHLQRIAKIREIEQTYEKPISILLDLQGPKIRVGIFEEGKAFLKEGRHFFFDMNPKPGNNERVYLPHPEVYSAVKLNQIILLDDGKIKVKIVEMGYDYLVCEVLAGGYLFNKKGVNLPECILPISALTEKDHEDLIFGLNNGVDWVALSFVQHPNDLIEAKNIIKDQAKLIAKLEKPQAIDALDEIIKLSDGIMVARGDLGVEMPTEEVPVLQRRIIKKCHHYGKPVIVATQMLESMISNPTPTRAEATDIATAVYEGADAVMLSAETAVGSYPLESVAIMDRIIRRIETEETVWNSFSKLTETYQHDTDICDAIVDGVHRISYSLNIKALVVFSFSGYTALRIAKSRPKAPILVLTPNLKTYRYLSLVWGIHPVIAHEIFSFSQMRESAIKMATKAQFVQDKDLICVVAGVPFSECHGGNVIHIIEII